MDHDSLSRRLDEMFDAEPGERRAVVRQALDLADAGRWAETHDGEPLTAARVVDELKQAPSDSHRSSDEARERSVKSPASGEGLADRWNWWIGALELAHGGFERFAVRSWRAE